MTIPEGGCDQQYAPDDVVGRRYYEPSTHGFEEEVRRRMEQEQQKERP